MQEKKHQPKPQEHQMLPIEEHQLGIPRTQHHIQYQHSN
jgi:hypothetical protein